MPFEDLTGFKRQVWRAITLAFLIAMLVNLIFHIASIYDRRAIRDISDARAHIAVKIVNAVAGGRALTEEEKMHIRLYWSAAEYDAIQKELIEK
jgi:hypothetical protein